MDTTQTPIPTRYPARVVWSVRPMPENRGQLDFADENEAWEVLDFLRGLGLDARMR